MSFGAPPISEVVKGEGVTSAVETPASTMEKWRWRKQGTIAQLLIGDGQFVNGDIIS